MNQKAKINLQQAQGHANREKRKINKVDYSTKEETAAAGLKTSHGNTNGVLMEDEEDSGMSHAKEPHADVTVPTFSQFCRER